MGPSLGDKWARWMLEDTHMSGVEYFECAATTGPRNLQGGL